MSRMGSKMMVMKMMKMMVMMIMMIMMMIMMVMVIIMLMFDDDVCVCVTMAGIKCYALQITQVPLFQRRLNRTPGCNFKTNFNRQRLGGRYQKQSNMKS